MKCLKCDFDNREGVKFCEGCGAKLELICPECRATIPHDRSFCGECGHDLRKPKEAKPLDYDQPHSYTPKHLADKDPHHSQFHRGRTENRHDPLR